MPRSILVFRGSSGDFVALGLDHDLAAQGSSPESALEALAKKDSIRRDLARDRGESDPFHGCRRSPAEYWQRYELAKPMVASALPAADVRAAL